MAGVASFSKIFIHDDDDDDACDQSLDCFGLCTVDGGIGEASLPLIELEMGRWPLEALVLEGIYSGTGPPDAVFVADADKDVSILHVHDNDNMFLSMETVDKSHQNANKTNNSFTFHYGFVFGRLYCPIYAWFAGQKRFPSNRDW